MTEYVLSIDHSDFWGNVDKSQGEGSCWPWLGSLMTSGYGRYRVHPGDSGRWRAHRIALCLTTGQPYRSELNVLHSCDNPPCCNPGHLSWGTQQDNLRDAQRKGRMTNGGKTWTRRFEDEDILKVHELISRGFSKRQAADELGMSKTYVEQMIAGRSKRSNDLLSSKR